MKFSEALKHATKDLHAEAERTGFVGDLLRRRGSVGGYALFLRNLLAAYQSIEIGLNEHREKRGVRAIAYPDLYRSAALRSDLDMLRKDWGGVLPILPAGAGYAELAAHAGRGDGHSLIAHAYVRYLGDLSGGQILKRLLSESIQLEGLSFYTFSGIYDVDEFKDRYRYAFDLAGEELDASQRAEILEEAKRAFQANIDLSIEVQSYSR